MNAFHSCDGTVISFGEDEMFYSTRLRLVE